MNLQEEIDIILTYGKTKGEWITEIKALVKKYAVEFSIWLIKKGYVWNGSDETWINPNVNLGHKDSKVSTSDLFARFLSEKGGEG